MFMGWDVVLMRTTSNQEAADAVDEKDIIPFDRDDVVDELTNLFPDIHYDDETFLILDTGEAYIEIYIGEEEQTSTITLTIRSMDEDCEVLSTICETFGCRALDTATGEFMD